jgi:hypothetical protein
LWSQSIHAGAKRSAAPDSGALGAKNLSVRCCKSGAALRSTPAWTICDAFRRFTGAWGRIFGHFDRIGTLGGRFNPEVPRLRQKTDCRVRLGGRGSATHITQDASAEADPTNTFSWQARMIVPKP